MTCEYNREVDVCYGHEVIGPILFEFKGLVWR